jgi:phosphoribosylaminoimidazole carboxylase (NCAIR synthetase)
VEVLAVELFVAGGTDCSSTNRAAAANSGHWTLDACSTDQFEQGPRALWPAARRAGS